MKKLIWLLLALSFLSGNVIGESLFAEEPGDINCVNRFKSGIDFLYGLNVERNPRIGMKLIRDASLCGDERAQAFVSSYRNEGGVIEPWKGKK